MRGLRLWCLLSLCALPSLALAQQPCVPQQTPHTSTQLTWKPAPAQPAGWTLTGYVLDGMRWATVPPDPRPDPETRSVTLAPDKLTHTLHGQPPGYYEYQVRTHATYTDGTSALSPYAAWATATPPCVLIVAAPTPPGELSAHPFAGPSPDAGRSPSRGTTPRAKR
jgi:hypothetical protein